MLLRHGLIVYSDIGVQVSDSAKKVEFLKCRVGHDTTKHPIFEVNEGVGVNRGDFQCVRVSSPSSPFIVTLRSYPLSLLPCRRRTIN
ncbi:hypothetical protein BVRB_3g054030 [Beta vulgaris subsp. vulgaris]|nr:hypothetical protein BVRB_3g054030 [Beta vulgaris subsp. vulgaris]